MVVLALLALLTAGLLLVVWRLGLDTLLTAWAALLFAALVAALVPGVVLPALGGGAAKGKARRGGALSELQGEPTLVGLHQRAAHLFGLHGLKELLQTTVDEATDLLRAQYGALSVQGHDGRILEFVFTGLSREHAGLLTHPPKGEGLLGVPLHEDESLRLAEMSHDPRFVGFPEHHPPMTSLLAVPVPCSGPFRGNLYLSDKLDGEEFSAEDEDLLSRFAEVAGVAIDTAHMRERQEALAVAEERLRIAREMHDGMAQVLGYVNIKAQAVGDHLRAERTEAAIEQMDQLASAAREVYAQVREGIVALRNNRSPEADLRTDLASFIDRWQERTGIPVTTDLALTEDAHFSPLAELQVVRIVQEALANVRRHSRADRVTVSLAQEGNLLVAVVEDDGVGFDPEAPPGEVADAEDVTGGGEHHFGLEVMRERAEAVGGRVEIRSSPGQGTRVEARVPLAPPVFR